VLLGRVRRFFEAEVSAAQEPAMVLPAKRAPE